MVEVKNGFYNLSILMMNISRNVDIINENEIVRSIHYLVLGLV
jgi:hypothetical protein